MTLNAMVDSFSTIRKVWNWKG